MTKVKIILCFISIGCLFWPVKYTLISWNSELDSFKKIKFVGAISNRLLNDFVESC